MIIKVLCIAFAIWVFIAIAFMCWMLCMVQKIYEEEWEDNKKNKNAKKEDKQDETAA